MRLPFLRPKPTDDAKPAKTRGKAAASAVDEPGTVEAARTQARRRLVGALVLLVIGVVGFPVLFETQPRPLPMNTPIEVVGRESPSVSGSVKDSPAVKPLPVTSVPADSGIEMPPAVAASGAAAVAAASGPSSAPARLAGTAATSGQQMPASAVASAAKAAAAAAPAPKVAAALPAASAAAAKPASASSPASAPASAAATGRFVVQAGAYTEAGKLREARSKIEQLGLKTYTQVIETDKGSRTRVRVGPFGTKAEADAVAAKIKRSGLPAAIVAL